MKLKKQLQISWAVNQQMNLRLLVALDFAQLDCKGIAKRSRNVRKIWAHMHHARLNWLGGMLKNPPKIGRMKTREAISTAEIAAALDESANAIAQMLKVIAAGKSSKQTKAFQAPPMVFLGMMIAHEAHHRAQILATLRHAGMPVAREVADALWDWDKN